MRLGVILHNFSEVGFATEFDLLRSFVSEHCQHSEFSVVSCNFCVEEDVRGWIIGMCRFYGILNFFGIIPMHSSR